MSEDGTPAWPRRSVLKAALASVGGFAGVGAATPGREPGPKSDEVLVGVTERAGPPSDVVAEKTPDHARVVHENEVLGYAAVKFPGNANAQDAFIERVTEDEDIEYAERNDTYDALYTPNDPYYGDQYAPQQVNADDAWDTTLGDAAVTISVVDTGIQYDHEDLTENMDGSQSYYGHDFVDDDANPYPDDLYNEYHGTHVGGIAAAATDNGTGVAGISDASLLSARALDEYGSGTYSDIADAVQWSADVGADIVNMSLGGSSGSSTLKNAVEYAYNNGVYIVAAAGNEGPCSDCVSYPAKYSECVAVSALDENEDLASFSSTGPEVELAAPGANVYSTTTSSRGNYEPLSGTSMATPVVSGVAALTLSEWNLSNEDLRSHINNNAVDVGLSGNEQGNGRVDADEAVHVNPSNGIKDGAVYRITAKHSDKVMDAPGGDNGDNIHQWDWHGGDNQHWRVDHLGDGEYRLRNIRTGKVADVEGYSTDNGGNIHQWDWHGDTNQRWRIEHLGWGEYRIVSVHSGKVADVDGAYTHDGANIHQWDWHGGDNQRWFFDELYE